MDDGFVQLDTQLAHYRGIIGRFVDWFAAHGVDFAVNTAVALLLLALGWLAAYYARRSAEAFLKRRNLHNKLRTRTLVNVATGAWWCLVALAVAGCYGVNVLPALAGLGVAGIVVGFAFQETLSSLAAGIMLSISEPFDVGDEVALAGYEGIVLWFGYTSTRVRTWDNRVVTLPNKQVWGAPIANHTRLGRRRCDRVVAVSYDSDPEAAAEVVRRALQAMPQVLADPPVKVYVTELADSGITLKAWPWCRAEDYWYVWEHSYPVIFRALSEAKIPIPYPQLDVHLPAPESALRPRGNML